MKRGQFARGIRGVGIIGAGLMASLAGIVHAEIVPVASPLLLAPGPAPSAAMDSGPAAAPEIVPAGGASAEIVPPPGEREAATPRPEPAGNAPIHPAVSEAVVPSGQTAPLLQPQPSANIRWPSVPLRAEPASGAGDTVAVPDATVPVTAADTAGVSAGGGGDTTTLPGDDTAEVTDVPEDPFERALAAYRGEADPRSYGEAARWFKVAATAGDRRAAIAYAYLQGLGLGVTRDPAGARRTLQQASDADAARADYLLSLLAAADRRPGSDRQQHELRERAARRGDPVAQNAMGVHYQVQGDQATAEMWYRRAADNGSAAARLNLGNLGSSDEARRQAEASTDAAADGDAGSLFEQARRHHRGDGVPVDYGKALQLYRQAAAKGSEPAQQMLGLIQSRTLPDGGFDPGWMRQLASAAVGKPGSGNLVPSVASAAQPRLDDPLTGLSDLVP